MGNPFNDPGLVEVSKDIFKLYLHSTTEPGYEQCVAIKCILSLANQDTVYLTLAEVDWLIEKLQKAKAMAGVKEDGPVL